jgi:hypothetical protein
MQIHSGQLKWVIRTMVNGTMIHGQLKEDKNNQLIIFLSGSESLLLLHNQ